MSQFHKAQDFLHTPARNIFQATGFEGKSQQKYSTSKSAQVLGETAGSGLPGGESGQRFEVQLPIGVRQFDREERQALLISSNKAY